MLTISSSKSLMISFIFCQSYSNLISQECHPPPIKKQKQKKQKNNKTKQTNKRTNAMTVLVHFASLIFKIIFQPHQYFILVDNYIVHTYGVVGLVVEVHGVHIHTSGHHAGSTAG